MRRAISKSVRRLLIIFAAKKEIEDLVQAYKTRKYDDDLVYLKKYGGKYQLFGPTYPNNLPNQLFRC